MNLYLHGGKHVFLVREFKLIACFYTLFFINFIKKMWLKKTNIFRIKDRKKLDSIQFIFKYFYYFNKISFYLLA
jgi:hypothetical protein